MDENLINKAESLANEQYWQERYNQLIAIFGGEAHLREEISLWFQMFVGYSEFFSGGDMEGNEKQGGIRRADFVFHFTQLMEYFTGNRVTDKPWFPLINITNQETE